VAYAFSDDMKIVDFGWHWRSLTTSTVGYPSDSWTSCLVFIFHFFETEQWTKTKTKAKDDPKLERNKTKFQRDPP